MVVRKFVWSIPDTNSPPNTKYPTDHDKKISYPKDGITISPEASKQLGKDGEKAYRTGF